MYSPDGHGEVWAAVTVAGGQGTVLAGEAAAIGGTATAAVTGGTPVTGGCEKLAGCG